MTIHIYPQDDWIEHRAECDCPCHPLMQVQMDASGQPIASTAIVIHRLVDPDQHETSPQEEIHQLQVKLMLANRRFLIVSLLLVLYSLWNIWFR